MANVRQLFWFFYRAAYLQRLGLPNVSKTDRVNARNSRHFDGRLGHRSRMGDE
jgi:hypothetical protein